MHREDSRSRADSRWQRRELVVDGNPRIRAIDYPKGALRGAPDGYRSEEDQASDEEASTHLFAQLFGSPAQLRPSTWFCRRGRLP
jgi:hypothetical protein